MFRHISYKDKMVKGAKELLNTNPKEIMKYGWEERDNCLGGIFGGEIIVVGGESGSGKAQPLYSKILTPTGFKTMGQINVGDFVIGQDGKNKKVLGIPFEGIDDIYEIVLSDGSNVHASKNHLFKVIERTPGLRLKDDVVSVSNMIGNLRVHNRESSKYSIPRIEPVSFDSKKHNIPPYTLGVLLGDGSLHYEHSTVRFTNSEKDVVDRVRSELPEGMGLTIGKRGNDIYLTGGDKNIYNKYIRESGLYGKLSYDKFIPSEYFYDSIENRLALLQGLMDSDGYIQRNSKRPNSCVSSFSTSSYQLCNDFVNLVRSFGARPRVSKKRKKYITTSGEKKEGSISYIITFVMSNGFVPVSSKKHLDRYIEYDNKKSGLMIKEINYLGKMECKCLSVEDELYITDNYILTHNSTICNQIANNVSKNGHRVVKYSLENRLENAAKEELFYMCNRLRRKDGKKPYKRGPFIANEYGKDGSMYDELFKDYISKAYKELIKSDVIELDKDRNVTIEDLVKLMDEEIEKGTRLFIIDHLHYFIFDDNERLDLQIKNVMHILNEMARNNNIAIILVAHYRNTTGWERGRGMKPNMGYFRDACFTGDTLIFDHTTKNRYTMDELFNTQRPCKLEVMDYKTQQKIFVDNLIIKDTGKRKIYNIKLENGTIVKASEHSKLWRLKGWEYVKDLSVGDCVGYSRRLVDDGGNFNEGLLYGLLLSNGYMGNDLAITLPTVEGVNKLKLLLDEFGFYYTVRDEINRDTGKITSYTVKIRDTKRPHKLKEKLRQLGLFKKKANEKFIPEEWLLGGKQFISGLLQGLYEGDGNLSGHTLSYATTSKQLADGIRYLWSQLGIETNILFNEGKNKIIFGKEYYCRGCYEINITKLYDVIRFIKEIGFMTSKNKKHIDAIDINSGRGSDYMPTEINNIILKHKEKKGFSWERMGYRVQKPKTCMPVREKVKEVGEKMGCDDLLLYANSCLSYSKIIEMECIGEHQTYDFEVPGYENFFLDNGLLVHNSSIKQVAHKIIQLVRDEDDENCDLEVTKFYFTKFRGPLQELVFVATFNLDYYEYRFGLPTMGIVKKEEKDIDIFNDMETETEFNINNING